MMASRRIEDLHPSLQPICRKFLELCKQQGVDIIITCTYRSNTEQDELYAKGRTTAGKIVTNAKAGQSKHNNEINGKPASLAFDIVPIDHGKAVWDEHHPSWLIAGRIGVVLGLNWYGSVGSKFKEYPHFEML